MAQRERIDMTGMLLSEQIKLVELERYAEQCEARIRDLESELAIARAKERP